MMNSSRVFARFAVCTAALMAVGAFATTASADFTTIIGPGETGINNILNTIYETIFLPGGSNATVFDNSGAGGTIVVTRVNDFFSGDPFNQGSNLNVVTGAPGSSSSDQVWDDGLTSATAHAKFAAFAQNFGFFLGGSGPAIPANFAQLGETVESGFQNTLLGSHDFSGADWRWGRTGSDLEWASRADDNSDDLDHMLTYQVTGLGTSGTTWLLFWDDQSGGGDQDFNDLVIEINAIPAPGAFLLGAMGLGLVGWLKRRVA